MTKWQYFKKWLLLSPKLVLDEKYKSIAFARTIDSFVKGRSLRGLTLTTGDLDDKN